jgi:hypothetical protein
MADTDTDPGPSVASTALSYQDTGSIAAPPPDPLANFTKTMTAGLPSEQQIESNKSYQSFLLDQKVKDEERLFRDRESDDLAAQGMMRRKYDQVSASTEDLKPWNQNMAPPPHNLWEEIGSPGFLFAMLGSAFSAMPMNTALAAGGAAINAINQGDMDAYDRAFNEWKTNSDLAIHRHQLEQEEFNDVVKLHDARDASWRNRAEEVALKYNDQRALGLLQAGMDPDYMKAYEGRREAMEKYQELMPKMMENYAIQQKFNENVQNGMGPMESYANAVKTVTDAKRGITSKAAEEAIEKAAIRADVDADPKFANSTEGQRVVETDKRYAAATSKVSGTPEALALQKFTEQNPSATAEQIQAFRQLGRSVRSPAAMAISKFVSEHPEASSGDITRFGALFNEAQSKARTLGTRSANVDVAVKEAEGAAKLALNTSDGVPRTDWVPVTELQQSILKGTSSPEMRAFSVANASLITAYAQTMSRTGTNTVTAQNRAAEVLNTADGPAAYKKGVETLLLEMGIVQQAVRDVEGEGGTKGTSQVIKWERKPDGTLGPAQ